MTVIPGKPFAPSAIRFIVTGLLLSPAGCSPLAVPVRAEVQELVTTASKHEESGEIGKSVEELKIALTIDPENKKAREELNRLIVRQQSETERHYRAGIALRDSNPQKARKEILEAIRLRPAYPEALAVLRALNLAAMEAKIKKRVEKEKKKEKPEPDYEDPYPYDNSLEIAVNAFNSRDYATAVREFEKLLAEMPGDPDILAYLEQSWYNSGVIHFNRKEYRMALVAFSKVRKGFERADEYTRLCQQKLNMAPDSSFTSRKKK